MIETVESTQSTNADMLARAAEGAPEGLWLRAERQLAGRGRLGRTWASARGNLYASTIVRLRSGDPSPPSLAFVAALAVNDVVAPHIAPERIVLKWPNDLLIDGAKTCGMLLERVGDAIVVGVGLNIASSPDFTGRRVTSLHQAGAPTALTAALLVEDLAAAFAQRVAQWRGDGLAAVLANWQQHAHRVGDEITVSLGSDERIAGRFAGLDDRGSLRLQTADGSIRTVHAGDVELVGQEKK